jgi:hypothetical protein
VVVSKGLSVRWHACPEGATSLHRDHNAALTILRLGQAMPEAGRPPSDANVSRWAVRSPRTRGTSAPAEGQGLFNFLNVIVSPSDQPQKYLAFVGFVLLVHVLVAVLDLKWGRGIAFTALALLAAAFCMYFSVVMLQGIRQSLEQALAEPQSRLYLGVAVGIAYWHIFELPVLLGQGISAVILSAVSRQRGWIQCAAIALALTVVAPFLAAWMTGALSTGADPPEAATRTDVNALRLFLRRRPFSDQDGRHCATCA